jgi:hypothetical protein
MNLLKLWLFNESSYMRRRCEKGIFVLCCNLVDLLLLVLLVVTIAEGTASMICPLLVFLE